MFYDMVVTVVNAIRSFFYISLTTCPEASQKRQIGKTHTRDQSGSTKPTLLRAKRGGLFREASVALTYEGADAVFNVSSYSGALLLQGTRKTDGGFATTKRLVQCADEGA